MTSRRFPKPRPVGGAVPSGTKKDRPKPTGITLPRGPKQTAPKQRGPKAQRAVVQGNRSALKKGMSNPKRIMPKELVNYVKDPSRVGPSGRPRVTRSVGKTPANPLAYMRRNPRKTTE